MSLFLQVLCSKRFLYVRCKLRLNTYISGQLISDYIFIHKKIWKDILKFRFSEKAPKKWSYIHIPHSFALI